MVQLRNRHIVNKSNDKIGAYSFGSDANSGQQLDLSSEPKKQTITSLDDPDGNKPSIKQKKKDHRQSTKRIFEQTITENVISQQESTQVTTTLNDSVVSLAVSVLINLSDDKRPWTGKFHDPETGEVINLSNCYCRQIVVTENGKLIPKSKKTAKTASQIFEDISIRTGNCIKACNGVLFIDRTVVFGEQPVEHRHAIDKFHNHVLLFAFLKMYFGSVEWSRGSDCVTQQELFEVLKSKCQHFDSIQFLPHHPELKDVYYAHSPY